MADLNQVALIGRLVRDAELKYTTGGKAVTKFSIAVNEKRKEGDQWKDKADFFEIVLWGQIGESLSTYLLKGKQIAITGKLSQQRWQQDGDNRSKVIITAQTVQLLSSGSSGSNNTEQKQESYSSSATDDGFTDDIPF